MANGRATREDENRSHDLLKGDEAGERSSRRPWALCTAAAGALGDGDGRQEGRERRGGPANLFAQLALCFVFTDESLHAPARFSSTRGTCCSEVG